jgi:hypothetical protein
LNQVQPRPRSYPLDLGAHSYVDFLQRDLVGLALRITFLSLNSWISPPLTPARGHGIAVR